MIKRIQHFIVFGTLGLSLWGCIGTDVEPPISPVIRLIGIPNQFHETGTYLLDAMYMNERGMEEEVSFEWQSSAPTILSVDQNGVAQALSPGFADVTVRFEGLQTATTIAVFPSEESISIIEAPDSLSVGQTFTLRAEYLDRSGAVAVSSEAVTWTVDDERVAQIDENGTIRGLWVGVVQVKVTSGEVSDSVSFEVNRAETVFEEELRMVAFTEQLSVGSSFQFEAQYFNSAGEVDPTVVPEWSSSAPTILSIDENGLASALTEGRASITASGNGRSRIVSVIVDSGVTTVVRSGSLRGTGYNISGDFSLVQEGEQLLLNFENASIDPNAPGPYFYLSNQERSVSGGVNLGKSQDGTFSINVTAIMANTTVDTYDYVVVWCEPFNVTLGVGSLSN